MVETSNSSEFKTDKGIESIIGIKRILEIPSSPATRVQERQIRLPVARL